MDPVWFAQYHSDSICVQLLSYFQCLAPASSFLEHRAMTQPKVLSYNIKFLSKVISNAMSPQSYITTAHQLWLHIVKMRLWTERKTFRVRSMDKPLITFCWLNQIMQNNWCGFIGSALNVRCMQLILLVWIFLLWISPGMQV